MWDSIGLSDIEQAKHNLQLRRVETLNRHAEEIKGLDDEQLEVDQLATAIAAFISKFGKGVRTSDAPATSTEAPPEGGRTEDLAVDQHHASTSSMNFRRYG